MCAIVYGSYQMQDYDGKVYNEANAKRHTMPSTFIQSFNEYISARKWQERSQRQIPQVCLRLMTQHRALFCCSYGQRNVKPD